MSDESPLHEHHSVFLEALASKHKLSVRYRDKTGKEVVQTCAALDFGPLRGAAEQGAHYQLWDLEAKKKPKNRVVKPADLISLTVLDDTFDPADIVTWTFKPGAWHVSRDWGSFS